MEKAITTALLTIASIIAAVAVMNAVVPAVGRGTGAFVAANSATADRVKTDIEVLFADGDTTGSQVIAWVKNVGATTIKGIDKSDVFLTTPTATKRLPYGSGAEYWVYTVEDGSEWTGAATIKVTLNLTSLATGTHALKMVAPNGIAAEKQFSVS